jgi:hypothetical protein
LLLLHLLPLNNLFERVENFILIGGDLAHNIVPDNNH